MHILYLVPHVPNPTKIRSHYQIQGLLDAGHRVTVATVERSPADTQNITQLRQSGMSVISARLSKLKSVWNAVLALARGLPLQARFMWSQRLMDDIQHLLKSDPPDVIHVEHLRMACYGLKLTDEWPVVWDAVDYLSGLYQQAASQSVNTGLRWVARIEAPLLKRYEMWLISQFPATVVISRKDQQLFQLSNSHAGRVQCVPQGLPITAMAGRERTKTTLVITGTLNYHPNIASVQYFVRDIFPLIQNKLPSIQLQLVGANPPPSLQSLQNHPGIEITGFVSSVMDYLTQATVALAPVVYGSGIQIKVLEAFASGTPLVATSVALRGLDVKDEQQVLIADTPTDFAKAVLRLLADPALRERLGAGGRAYVEANHDLRRTTKRLISVYQQVTESALSSETM